MTKLSSSITVLLLGMLLPFSNVFGAAKNTLKVYIDQSSIDFDYLREEINYVDYVFDPQTCDVQLILMEQTAGNGGSKIAIRFIGKSFIDIDEFILNATILPDDSDDTERKKLVKTIQTGLLVFMNELEGYQDFEVQIISNTAESSEKKIEDRWKKWVFNINGSGSFTLEENYNDYAYIGSASASQIKENYKLENRFYSYNAYRNYQDTIKGQINIHSYSSKIVFSLNEHWSAGAASYVFADTRMNTKLSAYLKPAIEYNLFPWSKSNKIYLTATYTVGPKYVSYNRKTIYNKTNEFLWDQTAYVKFLTKQSWGEASTMLTVSNYLNQWDKYNLQLNSDFTFYLMRGFSLTLSFTAEDVNNQLYIPSYDNYYTNNEILLGSAKQLTGYYLTGSIGLSFRFGSLTNNIVNRRL